LHRLARPAGRTAVWNPLTWSSEKRDQFVDPATGQLRPVAGMVLPFASALCSGGLTRFLPNQWDLLFDLRTIPDSVEEFTGFYKHRDLLGGDWLGHGQGNLFKAAGHAAVRNVRLPARYKHVAIPDTRHLATNTAIRTWLNAYHPERGLTVSVPEFPAEVDTTHIEWAAEVWYAIKKHWVLELQRWIQTRRERSHVNR
jgi:hypothetical protein